MNYTWTVFVVSPNDNRRNPVRTRECVKRAKEKPLRVSRCGRNLAEVERDAEVENKVAGELRIRVHNGLQVVDGDLVQVTVTYRAHRVERLARLTRLVKVRLLDVLAKYVVLACAQHQPLVTTEQVSLTNCPTSQR